ncbi:MAG: hypothetical protein QG559_1605 [Campylobacterota bacterium]|nr:hypothetical protein [Campylobacterota bacterium]
MSIVVISLPIMIQTTSRAIEDNIVQEAIFAASAELMGATSYYWDNSRSMEDADFSRLERVVDVDSDCNAGLRIGHINQPYHRRCLDSNATGGVNYTTAEATGVGLNRSVHAVGDVFDGSAAEAAGYKQKYQSKMEIAKGLNNNNIKELTASIYTYDGATLLTSLKTYSANIGEIDYYKRRF